MGKYDKVQVYNGSRWLQPKRAYVYNGTSWIDIGGETATNENYKDKHIFTNKNGISTQVTKNQWKVVFRGKDNVLVSTAYVFDNEDAIAPTPPDVANYTFDSWLGSYTNVTSDVTITASYSINGTKYSTPTGFSYDNPVQINISNYVNWSHSTGGNPSQTRRYEVQRSLNGGGWSWYADLVGWYTSFTPEPGWSTVRFRVKAYDATGFDSDWGYSSTASVAAAPTNYSTPGGFTFDNTVQVGTSNYVNWDHSTGGNPLQTRKYDVQRSLNGGAWSSTNTGVTGRWVSFTPASSWSSVRYRVMAYDDSGYGSSWGYSSTMSVYSAPTNYSTPGALTYDNVIKVGTSNYVNWGHSTGGNPTQTRKYDVERSLNGGSWTVTNSGVTGRWVSFTPASSWSTVRFRVRAYDDTGYHSAYRTGATMSVATLEPVKVTLQTKRLATFSGGNSGHASKFAIQFNYDRYFVDDVLSKVAYSLFVFKNNIYATTKSTVSWDIKIAGKNAASGSRVITMMRQEQQKAQLELNGTIDIGSSNYVNNATATVSGNWIGKAVASGGLDKSTT